MSSVQLAYDIFVALRGGRVEAEDAGFRRILKCHSGPCVGAFLDGHGGEAVMHISTTDRLASRLSQFAIVCLLLLIASPFTAPFATCDLNSTTVNLALTDDRGHDSISAKILLDAALPVFVSAPGTHPNLLAALPYDSASSLPLRPHAAPVPLRL